MTEPEPVPEYESEYESEYEHEYESEPEYESEYESEPEYESKYEHEYETDLFKASNQIQEADDISASSLYLCSDTSARQSSPPPTPTVNDWLTARVTSSPLTLSVRTFSKVSASHCFSRPSLLHVNSRWVRGTNCTHMMLEEREGRTGERTCRVWQTAAQPIIVIIIIGTRKALKIQMESDARFDSDYDALRNFNIFIFWFATFSRQCCSFLDLLLDSIRDSIEELQKYDSRGHNCHHRSQQANCSDIYLIV